MISYVVKINNVDVSAYIRNEISPIPFIDTNDDYSVRATQLTVSVADSMTPLIGQSIEILRVATTVFTGYIHNIQRDRIQGIYILECYSLVFKLNQYIFDADKFNIYLASLVAGTTQTATAYDDGLMQTATAHGLSVNDVIILYTADFNECIPYYYYIVDEVVTTHQFKFTISKLLGVVNPLTGEDYDFAKVTATSEFIPCVYQLGFNNVSLKQVLDYIFSLVGATIDTSDFSTLIYDGDYLADIGFDDRMLMMVNQSSTQRQTYDAEIDNAWVTTSDIINTYISCFELLSEITSNLQLQIYSTGLNTYKITRLSSSYTTTIRWGLEERNELARTSTPAGSRTSIFRYIRDRFDSRFDIVNDDPLGYNVNYGEPYRVENATQTSYNNLLYVDLNASESDFNDGSQGLNQHLYKQLAAKIDANTKTKSRAKNIIPIDLTPKACFNCYINQDNNYDTMEVEEVTFT